MLTKNFYCGMAAAMFDSSPTPAEYPALRTLDGITPSLCNYLHSYAVSCIRTKQVLSTATPTDSSGIVIGTGNAAPTIEDYAFSGDIITTFAYSITQTFASDEDGAELTDVLTITNTGSADFTIREIGIVGNPSSSGNQKSMLLERTVLDTPVTIPAGGVGQVTYTIRMDYPTE